VVRLYRLNKQIICIDSRRGKTKEISVWCFRTHFRKLRKQLTNSELRRAARKPWRKLRCNEADLLAAAVSAAAAASVRPVGMVE